MAPHIFVLSFLKAHHNINEQVSCVIDTTHHTLLNPPYILIHLMSLTALGDRHTHAVLSQTMRQEV